MTPDHTRQPPDQFWRFLVEAAESDDEFVGVVPILFPVDGTLRDSVSWATVSVYNVAARRNVTADDIACEDDPRYLAALGAIRACDVARQNATEAGAVLKP